MRKIIDREHFATYGIAYPRDTVETPHQCSPSL